VKSKKIIIKYSSLTCQSRPFLIVTETLSYSFSAGWPYKYSYGCKHFLKRNYTI